jgi:hypothetical protein
VLSDFAGAETVASGGWPGSWRVPAPTYTGVLSASQAHE